MDSTSEGSLPPFPDEGRHAGSWMARSERADHLAAVPLFAGCSKRQLRHVAAATRHHQFEADQVLVDEGARSLEAYLIVAGRAVVRRGGDEIAEIGPGSFVGEVGLMLGRAHAATVVTTTPVEVLAVDQRSLRAAIEEVPELGWALVQSIAARFADEIPDETA